MRLQTRIAFPILHHPKIRKTIKDALTSVGFETTHWARVIMYQRCFEFIRSLDPAQLDVLEISAGPKWKEAFEFHSYEATQYPSFDICSQILEKKFDLIIADQVFEHLKWPYRAGKNVLEMLKPGGYLIISVPFLINIHEGPMDCSRWTEDGLKYFLEECRFPAEHVKTGSWGNRACVKANFRRWRRYGWYRSLSNEPTYPVMVWAFAQKPVDSP